MDGLEDCSLLKYTRSAMTESLFDTYSMDFYDNPTRYEHLENILVSSCGTFSIRRLAIFKFDENNQVIWDGSVELAEKLRHESSIYFKKSERNNFTFQSIANNYEEWILYLTNNNFYHKRQTRFPEYSFYVKDTKKNNL